MLETAIGWYTCLLDREKAKGEAISSQKILVSQNHQDFLILYRNKMKFEFELIY